MGPWYDFLLLTLALGCGWLGWVSLTLAGWRPPTRAARNSRRAVSALEGDPRGEARS